MKKRFFALLLAAMMIAAAIPTAAFAAEEAQPQGVVRKCPICCEGNLQPRLASEAPIETVTPKTLTICNCGYPKYNCWRTVLKYEQTYNIICNLCHYIDGSTHEYVTRAVWEHLGCKGSGCGH